MNNSLFSLSFPGNPWVSHVIAAVLYLASCMAVFAFILHVLKVYIPGKNRSGRIVGMILGILIGVFAAKALTFAFCRFYPDLDEDFISLTLLIFALLNGAIVIAMYSQPGGTTDATDC